MAVLEAFIGFCRKDAEPQTVMDFIRQEVEKNPEDVLMRLFAARTLFEFGFTDEAIRVLDSGTGGVLDLVLEHVDYASRWCPLENYDTRQTESALNPMVK